MKQLFYFIKKGSIFQHKEQEHLGCCGILHSTQVHNIHPIHIQVRIHNHNIQDVHSIQSTIAKDQLRPQPRVQPHVSFFPRREPRQQVQYVEVQQEHSKEDL